MTAWADELARWDPGEPRDWHGRWGKGGSHEAAAAQQHLASLAGKVRLREVNDYNLRDYQRGTLDPAYHYTAEQQAAILRYQDSSTPINRAARGQAPDTPGRPAAQLAADVEHLSAAMQPLPEDLVLLRELSGAHRLDDVQPGDVLSDLGFSSTTLTPGRFAGGRSDTTVMHILAPAGTPTAWLGKWENEMLLDRDTPFVIVSKTPRPGRTDVTDVNVLLLPKGKT